MTELSKIHFQYKGREARRKDSQLRRVAILEAALHIIVQDGLRELRHRAVAKQAKVPLSATTYYFPNIESLIHDAYVFHTEQGITEVELLHRLGTEVLESFRLHGDKKVLRRSLREFILQHITSQVNNQNARLVEWTFRQQALRDPELAAIIELPKQVMLKAIADFFLALAPGSSLQQAEAKANIVLGSLLHMEYELLNHEQSKIAHASVELSIDILLDSLIS